MDSARPDQTIDHTMDRIEREAKRAAQAKARATRPRAGLQLGVAARRAA